MAMTEQSVRELRGQLSQMPHLTRAQTDALAQLVSDRTVEKAVDQFKRQAWKMAVGGLVASAAMTGSIVELLHLLLGVKP